MITDNKYQYSPKRNQPITSRLYREAFTGEREALLIELTSLFYDRSSYVRGDSHDTAYNEGQRSVIMYILQRVQESLNQAEFEKEDIGE